MIVLPDGEKSGKFPLFSCRFRENTENCGGQAIMADEGRSCG